jgi:Zn-dependent protease with chaperone function
MNYQAKLPDESVNVSNEGFLFQALKLLTSLALIVGIFYLIMIFLVNLIVTNLSVAQEKKLLNYIAFDANISNQQNSYLTEIKDRLNSCANLPYDVEIYISSDEQVNAFALPGGVIYITRGMLKELNNKNELAFVIGHELGHFKNKDHLKGLGHSLVLLTLALLLGNDYDILGYTLSTGGAKYSQAVELHSDKVGLELMQCAYGSVTDATRLFERMAEGKNKWEFFLASHPNFDSRVHHMHRIIEEQGMDTSQKAPELKNILDK